MPDPDEEHINVSRGLIHRITRPFRRRELISGPRERLHSGVPYNLADILSEPSGSLDNPYTQEEMMRMIFELEQSACKLDKDSLFPLVFA